MKYSENRLDYGATEASDASVRGLRSWMLDGGAYLLGHWKQSWRVGENIARCVPALDEPRLSREHQSPHIDCTCGIHSWWSSSLPPYQQRRGVVLGVIEGYGYTLVGELGFRCERAQLLAVSPNRRDFKGEAEYVGYHYGVPVLRNAQSLIEEFLSGGSNGHDN